MKSSATVNFQDLLDGHEWVNAGNPSENTAFVSRITGQIHYSSMVVDIEEPLPDDIDDGRIYLEIPHKYELDLGNGLTFRFVEEHLPEAYDTVAGFFRQRGAYAKFKHLLEQNKKLQDWYDYRNNAEEAALREWCAENDIRLEP